MQNIMATASPPVEELPSGLPPLPSYEEAVRLPNIPNPVPPPPDYAKTMQESYPPQVNSPPPVISPPQVTVQNVVWEQALGEGPVQIQCPACLQVVVTRLEHSSGILTWVLCASLFIVGCSYGCCLIPFCWDGLKDVTHYCPSCNYVLGVFRRL
ncbi:lipopolysaccharide-induced tumor necrosis factor-alpha factor homolog isoform X1 [Brienomyrus brachyistius]|uniref:lipopolysaccharide-induced tumor necrosis factor-alpha factor homolog isoform X1 n=2 Tax=Brienomyrus brachyistius TaxID=42636 RepID=UPI0020B1C72B|nr:lipopolysaccharide-induced tumor necrosis factor-alpha factor homolog isoform X1 [Brienomyrus brachyistius]